MAAIRDVIVKGPAKREPSGAEQSAIAEARQRSGKRRPAFKVGYSFEHKENVATIGINSAHSDEDGWSARLFETFGTASDDFVSAQIARIGALFRDSKGNTDPAAIEAVVAVLDGARPANEIEAMLVIQMATTQPSL